MRSLLTLALVLALAAPLAAADATRQYVILDGTRLLAKPAAFAHTVAKLRKGLALMAKPAKAGYVMVSVDLGSGTQTGYVAARSLQDHQPKLTSGARASGDASAQEVAAATKGFNRQIEANLRASDTAGGYAKLDQGLGRTGVADPRGGLEGWRQAGKLGEFQEGGQ